jgi:hypothetical protein
MRDQVLEERVRWCPSTDAVVLLRARGCTAHEAVEVGTGSHRDRRTSNAPITCRPVARRAHGRRPHAGTSRLGTRPQETLLRTPERRTPESVGSDSGALVVEK